MFILFAFVGNDITATVPYIFLIVSFISFLWVYAVSRLGLRYKVFRQKERSYDNKVIMKNTYQEETQTA